MSQSQSRTSSRRSNPSKKNAFLNSSQRQELERIKREVDRVQSTITSSTELKRQAKQYQKQSLNMSKEESRQAQRALLETIPHVEITGTILRFITRKELEGNDIAVCEIKTDILPDGNSETTSAHGSLYDPLMGPYDRAGRCNSCSAFGIGCPGHFGKIMYRRQDANGKLVPNPTYSTHLRTLVDCLNCVCEHCGHLKIPPELGKEMGLFNYTKEKRLKQYALASIKLPICSNDNECPACYQYKVGKFDKYKIMRIIGKGEERPIFPIQVYNVLSPLTKAEYEALGFSDNPAEVLIEFGKLVTPPITRPPKLLNGIPRPDDFTVRYQSIVREELKVEKIKFPEKVTNEDAILNYFFDASKPLVEAHLAIVKESSGTTQKKSLGNLYTFASHKTGALRKIGASKNTDNSARTVLGPGFRLRADEIGIPQEIAEKLARKEIAAEFNIKHLQELLEQGKVNSIRREDQPINILPENTKGENRFKIQIGDWVYRQLQNGDILPFGRNPTLHKQSLMGHRVKIINGKSIRLPLVDTVAYNADYDGDEGNLHATIEIETLGDLELMMVGNSLESESTGSPLIALTYNSLSGLHMLTQPKTKVSKSAFSDVVMIFDKPPFLRAYRKDYATDDEYEAALSMSFFQRCKDLNVNPYSGRAIFSLLLPATLNYRQKMDPPQKTYKEYRTIEKFEIIVFNPETKEEVVDHTEISGLESGEVESESREIGREIINYFDPDTGKEIEEKTNLFLRKRTVRSLIEQQESLFEIKNGILISGTLNKSFIGTGARFLGYYYKEYKDFSIDFLSNADTIANWYIEKAGLTVGLEDIVDFQNMENNKKMITNQIAMAFLKARSFGEETGNPIEDKKREANIINALNIAQDAGATLLRNPKTYYPQSTFRTMNDSGAKGKDLNASQASATEGMKLRGGEIIKKTMGERASPFFPVGSTNPQSFGFCKSSLFEGLTPSEELSSAISTRYDMGMMKLGTPKSGYIQRRFVQLMQGLVVNQLREVTNGSNPGDRLVQSFYGCGFPVTALYRIKDDEGEYLSRSIWNYCF